MDEPEYVYRTTNGVKCEWCGAEPGKPCHDDRGPIDAFVAPERARFHTIRVDPTSEPAGILGPKRPDNAFRRILPPPAPQSESEKS